VSYVGNLSADATTQKLKLYQKLEGDNKKLMQDFLEEQDDALGAQNNDWQSANFSRTNALKFLKIIHE
jgi:hypothetical protein